MSVTEEQIKELTLEHRIVWFFEFSTHEVEMGLYRDQDGDLMTSADDLVVYRDGKVPSYVLKQIVKIIPPAFKGRRGLVIAHPYYKDTVRLVHTGAVDGQPWLGKIGLNCLSGYWYSEEEAVELVKNEGWVVADDLSKS